MPKPAVEMAVIAAAAISRIRTVASRYYIDSCMAALIFLASVYAAGLVTPMTPGLHIMAVAMLVILAACALVIRIMSHRAIKQISRTADWSVIDKQTHRLQTQAFDDSVRRSTERRAELVKKRLGSVRLEGLAAALHDATHRTRTECPYNDGSRSSLNWHTSYNRVMADCAEQVGPTKERAA